MFPDILTLQKIIRATAQRELLPRFADVARESKTDGSIVTIADQAMQSSLQAELLRFWPEYSFIGEEMRDAEQQDVLANNHSGFWCLDPLDGTSNFAAGVPFFAVSLALIKDGEVQLGIVCDPLRDECFTALKGQGAWLNGVRLTNKPLNMLLKSCIAVVDFKRLPVGLSRQLIERAPYASQRNFGSVALEWCWLAAGRYHAYLHGGQKVWDYAAGSLILAETGGEALTLEGHKVGGAKWPVCSVIATLDKTLFPEWRTATTHE